MLKGWVRVGEQKGGRRWPLELSEFVFPPHGICQESWAFHWVFQKQQMRCGEETHR